MTKSGNIRVVGSSYIMIPFKCKPLDIKVWFEKFDYPTNTCTPEQEDELDFELQQVGPWFFRTYFLKISWNVYGLRKRRIRWEATIHKNCHRCFLKGFLCMFTK